MDVETLLDTKALPRIITGRTGAGKTALLKHLELKTKNSIFLSPEDFSFQYLADSSVLRFFEEAGVSLNIFYHLLWRHVLCVELIKKRYDISNEAKMNTFIQTITAKLKGDKGKKEALKYIQEWGEQFWHTTEERIKEITRTLESELKVNASTATSLLNLGGAGARKLTEEQRIEVVNIGKSVVNKIQIQKLSNVIKLLDDEIFDDPKNPYYVLIDQLDENWAEETLRNKIVRALIDNIKKFQNVRNVKIIISLREDLLHRVIRDTKDPGFQAEKLESLYLRLSWTEAELEKILDLRMKRLFRRQYSDQNANIRAGDIFTTAQRDRGTALGYILKRTFLRPREAILFTNYCLEEATGKSTISYKMIHDAELKYSRKRMESLADEWVVDYPLLTKYVKLLYSLPCSLSFKDFTQEKGIDDILLEIVCSHEKVCDDDLICRLSQPYIKSEKKDRVALLKSIICAFYQVGLIGVKVNPTFPIEWSYDRDPLLEEEKIKDGTMIYIHKTFWRALAITDKSQH